MDDKEVNTFNHMDDFKVKLILPGQGEEVYRISLSLSQNFIEIT